MADHNIYLYAVGGTGSNQNPTTPWEGGNGQQTQSSGSGFNGLGAVAQGASFMQSPDSLVGAAISKAVPYLAALVAAKVVVDVGLSVWSKHADWYSMQTGDYEVSIALEDLQANIKNLSSPFSTLIAHNRTRVNNIISSERNAMNLRLLGDSVLNSYANRGI